MRPAWPLVHAAWVVAAVMLGGCTGSAPQTQTAVVTASAGVVLVHRADGDQWTRVELPAAFGTGVTLATAATQYQGAEPSVGIDSHGNVFAIAFETIVRSQDQGKTWTAVHTISGEGANRDPMLWVDGKTDRVYAMHMNPARTCRVLAVSDDAGKTWTDQPLICPYGEVDHQKLSSGPLAGPTAVAAGATYPSLVTMCYNSLQATRCAASHDGGRTFPQDVLVDGVPGSRVLPRLPTGPVLGDCGGLNGSQHHAADGTLYLPYGFNCAESRIAVSTDGGLTWTRRAPKQGELELDPEVTTTPDGTAYYLYRGRDQLVHLLRSHDRFATTEGPFLVSPQARSAVFAGMVAGLHGRLAIAYLGTPDTAAGPDDAPASTTWNLYVAMTLDADAAAPTFVTVQANAAKDPVQRGSIALQRDEKDGNRNLDDFIDMSLAPDGRFWVSFTDGCTSQACKVAGAPPSASRSQTMSLTHLQAGPSLLDGTKRLA